MTMAVPVSWQQGSTPPGGDVGVLEQLQGDEAVVGRGLGVVEDGGQLGEVAGPEQVGDVAHGLAREQRQGLGLDPQERVPAASKVETWSAVSSRYGVSSGPSGSTSW